MSVAPVPHPTEPHPLAGWMRVSGIVGVLGVVVCLIGVAIDRTAFFRAWLLGFCVVLGLPLGSLVVIMLNYLVGGNWGFVLRRFLEAATRTIPLVALFFVPLAFGLHDLYEWTHPEVLAKDKILANKTPYLNAQFFLLRAVIYFAVWSLLALLLNRWSKTQDAAKSPAIAARCGALSAPGIILYALTITFASIDWVMSLEPHWYSTIFMAIFGMGQVLTGFVFCTAILLVVHLKDGRPEAELSAKNALTPQTLNDLGTLSFAFVMVWAYLSFCQYLLIWSGNVPVEVTHYLKRATGGWQYVAIALMVFHFALPFFLLLNTQIKRNPKRLLAVVLWVLFMRVVEMAWIVVPSFQGHEGESAGHGSLGWLLYPAAVVGLGGLWFAFYLWQLGRMPLLPKYNPQEAGHGEVAHH